MMTLNLTAGDGWDEPARAVVAQAVLEVPPPPLRNRRQYIERFRERMPLARAIRLKCSACMGGDPDRMPLGDVARAVDECASTACPLWPFRFGRDPWREVTDAQREASRANAAKLSRAVPITAREREGSHAAQRAKYDLLEYDRDHMHARPTSLARVCSDAVGRRIAGY